MTISGLRTALEAALDGVTGLNGFNFAPNAINSFPAAYVDIINVNYHLDVGGDATINAEVILVAERVNGVESAQSTIDEYIEASGTKSILAALEAATLSTHAKEITVDRWEKVRAGVTINGNTYQAGRFNCRIWT
jgi:hypothetical protein